MAPPENDPTHSSASSSSSSSSQFEVQTQKYSVKPSSSKPIVSATESLSSGEEEGEESESGHVPMKETPKKSSKAIASGKSKRRAAPEVSEKGTLRKSKRTKKNAHADAETEIQTGTKKLMFERIWTHEDEIALLQGMLDYYSKKKANPLNNLSDFYNFIKKTLSIRVSTKQLNEKVRRLRIKYENNAKKTKNGKEKILSKAHDQACHILSKKIWGENGLMSVLVLGIGSPKINEVYVGPEEEAPMENVKNVLGKRALGGRESIDQWDSPEYLNNEWKLIVGQKKNEWEKKWMKQVVKEIEVYVKRAELTYVKAKLILEAMKSSEEGTGESPP